MSKCPHDEKLVFNGVTLTDAYTGNTSGDIECRSDDEFTIIASYAKGSSETGNTCDIEVCFSPDSSIYAQVGYWSVAAASTFTAKTFSFNQDTTMIIPKSELAVLGQYMRIRAKETGVATNYGTLTLYLYRNKP